MNLQPEIEPYWQDEDDWLCTIEFVPSEDTEGRLFAADTIGYLFGYAQLTNTRSLALVGDSDAGLEPSSRSPCETPADPVVTNDSWH
jgi:hypothetical protein